MPGPHDNQPSASDVVRAEVVYTARRIVEGELQPYQGAAYVWMIMAEINYEGLDDLRGWVGLASEWQDSPQHREALEADILDKAKRLVEQS